jgi:hypothetical protein
MLIQLVIKNADLLGGKVRFALPVYTYCDINVLSFQFANTNNSNHTHLIQLKSDVLVLTNSPTPFLTFITQQGSNPITLSDARIHIKDILLNGNLTLEPIDVITGTTPANFAFLILTLEITPK